MVGIYVRYISERQGMDRCGRLKRGDEAISVTMKSVLTFNTVISKSEKGRLNPYK